MPWAFGGQEHEEDLTGQQVSDDDVGRLLSSKNSRWLLEFDTGTNPITGACSQAIASFVKRTDTAIESLDVSNSSIDVESSRMLLSSIPKNSTLRQCSLPKLFLPYPGVYDDFYYAPVKVTGDLIVNNADFKMLCRSNHSLCCVGESTQDIAQHDASLRRALEINGRRGCSVNQRLRSKLRAFYFEGEFSIQPFLEMGVEYMPDVLELVTMSDVCVGDGTSYVSARFGHLGSVYRLVRNCHMPELFGYASKESESEKLKAMNALVEQLKAELAMFESSAPGCVCAQEALEGTKRLRAENYYALSK